MAEGEERWRKYIDPDGVARIPDDEFRGLLARFEEVQAELERQHSERDKAVADLERAQGFCREARDAIHRLCLERGSTEGFTEIMQRLTVACDHSNWPKEGHHA